MSSRGLVLDQWGIVRAGVEAVLRRNAFTRVVACSTATAAVAAVRDRSKPIALAVVGVCEDVAQRDVVRELASVDGMRIVVLLGLVETTSMLEMLEGGAHAVVDRQARELDLAEAVQRAREGQRYVSPLLLGELFDEPRRLLALRRPSFALTARERVVLEHLVAGRTNADIAQRLSIAPETVKTHLARLYGKLDVHNRAEAVAVAVRHALV